jgi:hypothetical protein
MKGVSTACLPPPPPASLLPPASMSSLLIRRIFFVSFFFFSPVVTPSSGAGEFLFDSSLPLMYRFQVSPLTPTPLPERVMVVKVLLDGATRVLSIAYKHQRGKQASDGRGKGWGQGKGRGQGDRQTLSSFQDKRRRLALQFSASFATIAVSVVDCFRQVRCMGCVSWRTASLPYIHTRAPPLQTPIPRGCIRT